MAHVTVVITSVKLIDRFRIFAISIDLVCFAVYCNTLLAFITSVSDANVFFLCNILEPFYRLYRMRIDLCLISDRYCIYW